MSDRRSMALGLAAFLLPAFIVGSAIGSARSELTAIREPHRAPSVAAAANESYCTPELKAIIRRVAGSCGLLPSGGGRGCQPTDAKRVAALSGSDFNALFRPMKNRAHLVQFDLDQAELDPEAKAEVEKAWADQRGASFFFVVSRASSDGNSTYNTTLSEKRAQGVLRHLETKFDDDDLKKEVGLLWLGDSFAQLGTEFCEWQRSRTGETCDAKEINRSAFVAWIDCAI